MNQLRSDFKETLSSAIGCQKLGQPVPESNFVWASNRGCPQQTQRYTPSCLLFQYSPVKARSVPFSRVTRYWASDNCCRHSASLFTTLSPIGLPSRSGSA